MTDRDMMEKMAEALRIYVCQEQAVWAAKSGKCVGYPKTIGGEALEAYTQHLQASPVGEVTGDVERVAKAIFSSQPAAGFTTWASMEEGSREAYRDDARAALAYMPTPQLSPAGLSVEEATSLIMEELPSCPIPFYLRKDTDPTGVKWAEGLAKDIVLRLSRAGLQFSSGGKS